jgi:hypothetical protein
MFVISQELYGRGLDVAGFKADGAVITHETKWVVR